MIAPLGWAAIEITVLITFAIIAVRMNMDEGEKHE